MPLKKTSNLSGEAVVTYRFAAEGNATRGRR